MNHPARAPKSMSCACALLILASPFAHALEMKGGSTQDQQQVQQSFQTWLDDYISGDVDRMMAALTEDSVILPQGQPTVAGLDAIRPFLEASSGGTGVTIINDMQELRINGTWAFVRGDFTVEVASVTEGEPGFKRAGRYLVLYEKNAAGEWRLLRDMDNDAPVH
jgi:ketosteroid isomerase-like protein